MDFTFDDEQKALQHAVRDLASRHTLDSVGGDVPVGPGTFDQKVWSALAEMGLLALPFEEDLGGAGATAIEVAIAAAELGRARLLTPYAEELVAARIIADAGSDAQQESLLPGIFEGDSLVLPALNEPGRAWSTQAYDVVATGEGDQVTLTGTKEPVSYAAAAEHFVVTARSDEGTRVYLVAASDATVSGDRVRFDGAAATALGDLSQAQQALTAGLNLGVLTVCAEALGAMDAALPMTVEYLGTRKQFGVPLAAFQTLTQRAADMYVSLELARSTVLYAAMVLAQDSSDSAVASRAKVVTGKSGRHIGQEAIQLHGGIGMTAEYAVGHYTARLTAIEHTFGDSRWHLAQLAKDISDHDQVDVLSVG